MRSSLLPVAIFLLVLPGAVLRADSRHGPAPATAADLTPLKDAVAALANGPVHDLSDSLGKTNTRLDVLEEALKRVDQNLMGVDLARIGRDEAAAKSAMGDLVRREDSLEEEERAAEAHLGEAAATASRQGQDLQRQLAGAESLLATLREQNRHWHEAWPKALAANSAAVAAAQQSVAEDATHSLWCAAGALALLIAAAALLQGRGRRARQQEVLLALTRLGAELRQARPAAPPPRLSPSETEWQRMEGRLRRLAERCESALRLEAVPIAPTLPEMAETAPAGGPGEQATVAVGVLSEPTIASRHLWPAEFLDPKSPLSRWRFLLESHFDDPEHPALPVLAGLLGLRVILERSAVPSAEVAAAAFRLSEALHAYLQSLSDLSADDRQQASAAWLQSMARMLGSNAPHLELREILPGLRVDTDLMHAVREGPGNHLNVAEVYSWAILDRSAHRARVLHRAQIAST